MNSRFDRAASVTLDGTGAGQVQIPVTGGDWVIVASSVQVTSNVKEPTAKLYRNSISDATFLEGSYTGSNDSSDTRHLLTQGEYLTVAWTGGDVGARATARITVVQYPAGMAPRE